MTGDLGVRERHTGSGHFRVRCLWCEWASGSFPTTDGADLAMSAHAEAVHGVTVGDARAA